MGKTNEFSVNDRITSSAYGEGTISAVDEKYTTIAFDHHGTRRFLTSLVKLDRSDSAPPVKAERPKKAK